MSMDDDEYLRRALEENFHLNEQHERQLEESRRFHRDLNERALRVSRADAERARQAAREEDDQLMMAIERSQAEERARARRLQAERQRLLQMDREFGSGPGQRVGDSAARANSRSLRNNEDGVRGNTGSTRARSATGTQPGCGNQRPRRQSTASSTVPQTDRRDATHGNSGPARSRSATTHQEDNSLSGSRARQPRLQDTVPSHLPQASTSRASTPFRANSARESLARRISSIAAPYTTRRHSHHQPGFSNPPIIPQPAHSPAMYSLSEILARSRIDAFPTGSFFPADADPAFDAALQAAINDSADQARDEEEEAVQRSRGIPTYEEACSMPRYRPPRGARYVFQGPKEVYVETGGEGEGMRVKVVGDMDLGEALRVANQNFGQRTGQGRWQW
ncbi:hypothetical protein D8B26_000822 [Coccidioides posadasii str. Silveira]|nr:hypothetical protein D8B26_000822 [Coccidioides posadasii str. Silveira]